jgi:hypothetical protein
LLSRDRFLLFNNNSKGVPGYLELFGGGGDGSIAIAVSLELAVKTAAIVGSYKANSSRQNDRLGDVQRRPNGNTLAGFSAVGVQHEVSPDGILLRE